MAAVNTNVLVLLDPTDQHQRFEQLYDRQLFSRFTDKDRCILHVMSSLQHVRFIGFFIPHTEHTIVNARITLFKNTIFYIYCTNAANIREMRRRYNYPMFVKIFDVQWLAIYLKHVAIGHLFEHAQRAQYDLDECDLALQQAAEIANGLADELTAHMIVKTGTQPDDS
ncbi:unnamed protein product [Rotaria socialis]|uniref:Uncharacterized protein n=2 Tax=Rotaria socialis TaxID=392032 RepID=A0A818BR36_9BILA|nr:unnamed protein product [Rotaria socialis]